MKKKFMLMIFGCLLTMTRLTAMEINDRTLDVNYKLPLGNGIPDDPFVSVWASIKDDPELAPYATSIDYMMCGSTVVIFGLVDSQEIKDAVERKIRPFAKGRTVQNKIIVKISPPPPAQA